MTTDHLAKAKDYIAKGEDYYRKAAEEIVAEREEHDTAYSVIADRIGRDKEWCRRLVQWHTSGEALAGPWAGEAKRRETTSAKKVAQERPEDLIAELPGPAVEKLAKAATETLVQRSRAERKEHDTTPTAGDLMGEDKFDPAEYWADTLVIRVNKNARELASLIQRAGGLLYGSMTPEEAFEYLHEAEGLIAEARAAAQEQSRDRLEVS